MKEIVFLIILTLTNTGNSTFEHSYHTMPDLETCLEVVNNAKINVATGGDTEAAVVMYCAFDKAKRLDYHER